MERNKLLRLASAVCTFFGAMQLVAIAAFTIILIHWHSDSEFYRNVHVKDGGVTYIVSSKTTTISSENNLETVVKEEKIEEKLSLADLQPKGLYFNYVKGVIYLLTVFFIFWELRKIIKSAQQHQTFRTANIKSFRTIGKLFLVIFLISGFHFIASENYENLRIDFESTPLLLMLVAYLLAEIFKEGHRLSEEEKLTI